MLAIDPNFQGYGKPFFSVQTASVKIGVRRGGRGRRAAQPRPAGGREAEVAGREPEVADRGRITDSRGVRKTPLKSSFYRQRRCRSQPDHPGIRKTVPFRISGDLADGRRVKVDIRAPIRVPAKENARRPKPPGAVVGGW